VFNSDLQAKDKRKAPYPCLISKCLYHGHCNDWGTPVPGSTTYLVVKKKWQYVELCSAKYHILCYIAVPYCKRQKSNRISIKMHSSWWGKCFVYLTFFYQFPAWYLWSAFCYSYLSLPMPVL